MMFQPCKELHQLAKVQIDRDPLIWRFLEIAGDALH
jgi:hypothetical protein